MRCALRPCLCLGSKSPYCSLVVRSLRPSSLSVAGVREVESDTRQLVRGRTLHLCRASMRGCSTSSSVNAARALNAAFISGVYLQGWNGRVGRGGAVRGLGDSKWFFPLSVKAHEDPCLSGALMSMPGCCSRNAARRHSSAALSGHQMGSVVVRLRAVPRVP